jgi:hypothetical protein
MMVTVVQKGELFYVKELVKLVLQVAMVVICQCLFQKSYSQPRELVWIRKLALVVQK